MNILPRIETLTEKKLVGIHFEMSLAKNETYELWHTFMPRRGEIKSRVSTDLISMKFYHEPLRLGDLHQKFEKWAAVEVSDFDVVPEKMDSFILKNGLYAIFHYKGNPNDSSIFLYIFSTWLQNSAYLLDDRPHFEILGSKFKKDDPNSEEEIWIPIKNKL